MRESALSRLVPPFIGLAIAAGSLVGCSSDAGPEDTLPVPSNTTTTTENDSEETPSTSAPGPATTLPPVSRGAADPGDLEGPRPVIDLDGCTPTWAVEGEGPIGLFVPTTAENVPVQLLAAPGGLDEPTYAIVQRFPVAGIESGVDESDETEIDGRPVKLRVADGAGEAQWVLDDGSEAHLRSRGFDRAELEVLVAALVPRGENSSVRGFDIDDTLETGGVEIVDESRSLNGSWITTSCRLADGDSITAVVLTGDPVFQYGVALDSPSLTALGVYGEALVAASGPAEEQEAAANSVTDTDVETWAQMLTADRG